MTDNSLESISKRLSDLEKRVGLLERTGGATNMTVRTESTPIKTEKLSGCIGAIVSLVSDGFLDAPKTAVQVGEQLRTEGQPYSKELISMNLLNLVKPPRKLLRRIREKNQWHYMLRK